MATRYKTAADVTLDEIQAAVEEAYENGIVNFFDTEIARAEEPHTRRIVIESMVPLEEDEE